MFKNFVFVTVIFSLIFLGLDMVEAAKKKKNSGQEKVRVIREIREVPASDTLQPSNQENPEQRESLVSRHKPKHFKVLTAYDVCKQECRRIRDQESERTYVERLREELRLAEEQLKFKESAQNSTEDQQNAVQQQQRQNYEQQQHKSRGFFGQASNNEEPETTV